MLPDRVCDNEISRLASFRESFLNVFLVRNILAGLFSFSLVVNNFFLWWNSCMEIPCSVNVVSGSAK